MSAWRQHAFRIMLKLFRSVVRPAARDPGRLAGQPDNGAGRSDVLRLPSEIKEGACRLVVDVFRRAVRVYRCAVHVRRLLVQARRRLVHVRRGVVQMFRLLVHSFRRPGQLVRCAVHGFWSTASRLRGSEAGTGTG